MSNVMSLKQIRNHTSRNAFDLSMRKCFTAKVGELLPVFFKEVIPGDKFKLGLQAFTRTQPVNSAAYTRIKEYYDYFFVPYRLLWRYSDQFFTDTQESNPQFALSINQNSNSVANRTPWILANDIMSLLNSSLGSTFSTYGDGKNGYNHSCFNEFGYDRSSTIYKLLKMLGYGLIKRTGVKDAPGNYGYLDSSVQGDYTIGNTSLNAFPLLAYQKIYQDYFRNSQWEKANPSTYNVDYLSSSNTYLDMSALRNDIRADKQYHTLFDLCYCNWNKDLFTGVMPSPQYGDTAVIGEVGLPDALTGTISNFNLRDMRKAVLNYGSVIGVDNSVASDHDSDFLSNGSKFSFDSQSPGSNSTILGKGGYFNLKLDSSQISSLSVLALRQAEALQKWREISLSGKQDYKSQIEKHFGVSVPDVRSNLCEWLGGTSSNLDISEVVNTNLQGMNSSDSTVQSNIAGKGVGVVNGHESFEAKEHGIIMCIYHAVPILDYSDDFTDPYMLKGSKYDYAIPEFDSIGMQSLPGICLSTYFGGNLSSSANEGDLYGSVDAYNSLGYVPRYVDYKTSVDVVTGEFSNSLKYWVAPLTSDYFKKFSELISSGKKLTSNFFKVNPSVLDPIFLVNANGSMSTDNLLINSFHDIKAVRNLDYNGLPY